MVIRPNERERGSTLAWVAVLLAVVVLPLMLLVGDGVRLLYVQGRLMTAADAACEDASWSVSDRLTWQRVKDDRYLANWYLVGRAQNTFYQMLAE
ncbi:MAG: pilus assembly protein TadG-related protein, partial [Anaerolinea sp.]